MAILILDTSALIKRYLAETGSAWLRRTTDPQSRNRLYVSSLLGPEMIATLARGARNQRQLARALPRLLSAFRFDWMKILHVIDVDDTVIDEAMRMCEAYGLRGADAGHLASALQVRSIRAGSRSSISVVSADGEQLAAAVREGFSVENPNERP